MIKWEHSVLTLPFGLTGAVLAARGLPSVRQAVWLVVALVSARSAAMAFNRLADAAIDAGNPRTATRALPAGLLSRQFVFWFVVVFSLILIFAARMLSQLAFYLSPVALIIIFGYSYTKRFTRWAHVFLGLGHGDCSSRSMGGDPGHAGPENLYRDRRGHVLGRRLRYSV